ncbi:hypothetical protein [Oceanivirga salmonicida]|uniref:hypothetical protein n=1 Tax=Oceanivirga salmonicida TaxID=1769291 RepID=UPI00082FB50A|nr:hypothetical protein [Oceanivirga salmonicida]
MRKFAMLIFTFVAMNSFAEWNIRTGFDFYRDNIKYGDKLGLKNTNGMGFVFGSEIIPIETRKVDFGAGFEYNFGVTTVHYNSKQPKIFGGKDEGKYGKEFIPIYALMRLNLYKKNHTKLYTATRFGGALTREDKTKKFDGGIYYGLGLGIAHKFALAELLYDGAYVPKTKSFDNKVGIRLGLRTY